MKTTNENKLEKNEQNLELNDTQLDEISGGGFGDFFKKIENGNSLMPSEFLK